MKKDIGSPRHEALRWLLYERRLRADLTQDQLAAKMGVSQSFVSAVERGDQRVSVLQLVEFAEALGFDPRAAVRKVALTARDAPADVAAKKGAAQVRRARAGLRGRQKA